MTPRSGKKPFQPRQRNIKKVDMPRPILILVVLIVVVLLVLLGLASLDREVPMADVEQPVANATGH
jgi:predicted RND superfamily exporter protein